MYLDYLWSFVFRCWILKTDPVKWNTLLPRHCACAIEITTCMRGSVSGALQQPSQICESERLNSCSASVLRYSKHSQVISHALHTQSHTLLLTMISMISWQLRYRSRKPIDQGLSTQIGSRCPLTARETWFTNAESNKRCTDCSSGWEWWLYLLLRSCCGRHKFRFKLFKHRCGAVWELLGSFNELGGLSLYVIWKTGILNALNHKFKWCS